MAAGFETQDKHAFSLANYVFEDGEAVEAWQISSFDVFYPPQNAMDPRPARRAQTTTGSTTSKAIVFHANLGISFVAECMVLSNVRRRDVPVNFDLQIQEGTGSAGPWTTVIDWTEWEMLDGGNIFVDFASAGTAPVGPYFRVLIRSVGGGGSIGAVQWGSIMVGTLFEPTWNPNERIAEDFTDMNVRLGRSAGGVVLSTAHNPSETIRAQVFVSSQVEADRLRRLLKGEGGVFTPQDAASEDRLNWVHGWVRPDRWKGAIGAEPSGTFGSHVLGHIQNSRLTHIRDQQYLWEFSFREIGGENE